jgi:hypothetical protein
LSLQASVPAEKQMAPKHCPGHQNFRERAYIRLSSLTYPKVLRALFAAVRHDLVGHLGTLCQAVKSGLLHR